MNHILYTPNPEEKNRLATIAHTEVWARLPDEYALVPGTTNIGQKTLCSIDPPLWMLPSAVNHDHPRVGPFEVFVWRGGQDVIIARPPKGEDLETTIARAREQNAKQLAELRSGKNPAQK